MLDDTPVLNLSKETGKSFSGYMFLVEVVGVFSVCDSKTIVTRVMAKAIIDFGLLAVFMLNEFDLATDKKIVDAIRDLQFANIIIGGNFEEVYDDSKFICHVDEIATIDLRSSVSLAFSKKE